MTKTIEDIKDIQLEAGEYLNPLDDLREAVARMISTEFSAETNPAHVRSVTSCMILTESYLQCARIFLCASSMVTEEAAELAGDKLIIAKKEGEELNREFGRLHEKLEDLLAAFRRKSTERVNSRKRGDHG